MKPASVRPHVGLVVDVGEVVEFHASASDVVRAARVPARQWVWTRYGTAYRALYTLYEITFAGLDFRAVWRILGDVRCKKDFMLPPLNLSTTGQFFEGFFMNVTG